MNVNFLRPAIQKRAYSKNTIPDIYETLLSRLKDDVLNGQIKINSINDFTKIVSTMIQVEELRKQQPESKENEVDDEVLNIINENDKAAQELYTDLFEYYNQKNDDNNR